MLVDVARMKRSEMRGERSRIALRFIRATDNGALTASSPQAEFPERVAMVVGG
jgi:hypothetical protein